MIQTLAALLFLIAATTQAAVFDLEALMAMADKDEKQKVAPPAQASPEQRAFIKKWSEVGPLFERQLVLQKKIDALMNEIDEVEYNEPQSWLDMFRKREDSPKLAGLKRDLKRARQQKAEVTDRLWRYYQEQAETER
jgi:hypothetical protein